MENDFLFRGFSQKVLINLSTKLCIINKKNYNLKFWEITIGYWLYVFLHVVYDRWEVISKIDSNEEYFLKQIEYNIDDLVANNTYDSINNFVDDYWNSYMFRKILNYRYSIDCYKKFYKKQIEFKKYCRKLFLKIFLAF